MAFAKFMAGGMGRGLRIVAGAALVLIGLLSVHGTLGIVLAVAGGILFLAGTLNVCLIAPIIGAPFKGNDALGA